jgi:hypothetical protein
LLKGDNPARITETAVYNQVDPLANKRHACADAKQLTVRGQKKESVLDCLRLVTEFEHFLHRIAFTEGLNCNKE